jgi:hypothetical protein
MMMPQLMIRLPIRTTTFAAAALWLAGAGCAVSKKDVRVAKSSGYQADFSVVYNGVLAEVRARYPRLKENANRGLIKTAWHVIRVTMQGTEDKTITDQQSSARSSQSGNQRNQFGVSSQQRERYFIRFDIHVIGGNPWRVRIDGHAQKWVIGEVAVDLKGADEPHWLKGRTDALYVAIYKRLERYAVRLKTKTVTPKAKKLDTKPYKNLPGAAATAVASVLDAARTRNYAALRAHMHDTFKWDLGAPGDAKQAMVMWKADPTLVTKLIEVLDKGCRADADGKRVTCPPAYTEQPGYLGYRVGFAPGPGGWKMIFFVTGD